MSIFGKHLQHRQSNDEVVRGIQMANTDGIVKGNTERVKKKIVKKDKYHI